MLKEANKDALDEVKDILTTIKSNHDQVVKSETNLPNDQLMSYFYKIVKPVTDIVKGTTDTCSDEESIYEDENTVAKTIFRSRSYDELENFESPQNLEEGTECNSHDSTKSKTFSLHDLSDSFNFTDSEDDENENVQIDKVVVEKVTEIAKKMENAKIEDEYPSINSSSGSIKFDDVIAGDILGDLEVDDKMDKYNQESNLSIDEQKIVNTIVQQLMEQLQPTLKTLSETCEKYELAKSIYKLPSVSDLNPQLREHSMKRIKQKKFKLEFHEDILKSMVRAESEKNEKGKAKMLIVSEKDQLRLNFNKFRHLNTIIEQPSLENTHDSITLFKCNEPTYNRQKDTRNIQFLDTEELHTLLKQLDENKSDDSKVSRLISLFENNQPKNKSICKLTDFELKKAIIDELEKRSV